MCAPGSQGPLQDHGNTKTENESSTNLSTDKVQQQEQQSYSVSNKMDLKQGVRLGTASLALLFVASTVTMPYVQNQRDELGCDSMCVGSMTSARSMLTLAGSALVGKLSDSTLLSGSSGSSRRICLVVGILASTIGLWMGYTATNIHMLWMSMIPGALLQQNTNVLKAMFSAYHDAVPEQSSSTDRAASSGLLGMAMGLALMAGPLAGVQLFSTYQQATFFGMICSVLAVACILFMPTPPTPTGSTKDDDDNDNQKKTTNIKNQKSSLLGALDTPSARTPAALFLMAARICMALSFHIFQTIWTASLKQRFDFGPKDYGRFISFIGLTYALSQGFLAKLILKYCGGHTNIGRVRLLLLCCASLGGGRYLAFHTTSLIIVYSLFAIIVTALGLVNSIFSADTSQIAPPDETGALFGILASVESAAGMTGPIVAGLLSYIHPINAPLFAVVGMYALVFAMILLGYERIVLKRANKNDKEIENLMQKKTV